MGISDKYKMKQNEKEQVARKQEKILRTFLGWRLAHGMSLISENLHDDFVRFAGNFNPFWSFNSRYCDYLIEIYLSETTAWFKRRLEESKSLGVDVAKGSKVER